LGSKYTCFDSPTYRQWLQRWATKDSPLQPPAGPLPPGTSLWLGASHAYETAAALMCQHHWEIKEMEVLNCAAMLDGPQPQCVNKTDPRLRSQPAAAEPEIESFCKMEAVGPNSRCDFVSHPNVWGVGGTQEESDIAKRLFPIPTMAREDELCGERASTYPACSLSITRYTFSNGHTAIVIHNHILQFYNHSLERFAKFLSLNMSEVNTIVYGSPWEMQFAQWYWTTTEPHRSYNMKPDTPTFFTDKFNEDIIEFAHGSGFAGNVVFTGWHSADIYARDVLAARQMMDIAKSKGINATNVFPFDVVKEKLDNHWCGPSEECTNFSLAAGHQCIPAVPDVVAWEVFSQLRTR